MQAARLRGAREGRFALSSVVAPWRGRYFLLPRRSARHFCHGCVEGTSPSRDARRSAILAPLLLGGLLASPSWLRSEVRRCSRDVPSPQPRYVADCVTPPAARLALDTSIVRSVNRGRGEARPPGERRTAERSQDGGSEAAAEQERSQDGGATSVSPGGLPRRGRRRLPGR